MEESRELRLRQAGRVIVLDPEDRVLLFRYDEGPPNGRHWCTPGGGLDDGEDYVAGARRELAEETGWTDVALGAEVYEWTRTMEFADAIVRQHERIFLARVETAGRGLGEVAAMHASDGIAAWHWWTLAEMDATDEVIWPPGLADLVRGLIGTGQLRRRAARRRPPSAAAWAAPPPWSPCGQTVPVRPLLRAGDAGSYAALVGGWDACLVDLYDTLLSCDFSPNRRELPKLAGVTADAWSEAYAHFWATVQTGRVSKTEAFGQTLQALGAQPSADLVRALVDRDRELALASARLYDDAIPFLEWLRSAGLKIAIVSNCSEHTRPLLTKLGVIGLADAVILSCEVGAAKPSAEIYLRALDRLGVAATAAVFVDDQASYCAGAAELGITAVQIVRGEPDGNVSAAGTAVVRSLTEVETMLWPAEGFKARPEGEDRLRGLTKEVLSCLGR